MSLIDSTLPLVDARASKLADTAFLVIQEKIHRFAHTVHVSTLNDTLVRRILDSYLSESVKSLYFEDSLIIRGL